MPICLHQAAEWVPHSLPDSLWDCARGDELDVVNAIPRLCPGISKDIVVIALSTVMFAGKFPLAGICGVVQLMGRLRR